VIKIRRIMIAEMTKYHPHIPVLLRRSVNLLITDTDGIYIDATLGGGGHSLEILNRLDTGGILYGIDQDSDALEAARKQVDRDPRFHTIHGNFGYFMTLLPPEIHGNVSGILFDLGVSTHQITAPERGFSFQKDGPLDMRMSDLSGVSAWQVVNDYPYEKLRDIIFHYGEERMSRQIANAIIQNRPVETTGELRDIIKEIVYPPQAIKTLARVFQAIRIEVNRELDMLKSALEESLEILKPGGRIVAISYHSLEDRILKTFFRSGNHEGFIEKDFYGNEIKPIEPLFRKVITPTEEEIRSNPASRSAKLRVAQKIIQEVQ
jgi:16S rRNA (cytosine1402-N4)-methyltransferase